MEVLWASRSELLKLFQSNIYECGLDSMKTIVDVLGKIHRKYDCELALEFSIGFFDILGFLIGRFLLRKLKISRNLNFF